MTAYTITSNQAFNSLEISFTEKPAETIREALKALKFRWHGVKKVWYGYADRETVEKALQGEQITAEPAQAKTAAKKSDKINLDNLGQASETDTTGYYWSNLSKAIREDLKKRGVKGCTVRGTLATHTPHIYVTIKATPEDFASLEEARERFTMSHFDIVAEHGFYNGSEWVYNYYNLGEEERREQYNKYMIYQFSRPRINEHYLIDRRADYWSFTTDFYNKVCAVYKIANQWNYNNSDSMTDYFDIGYFLDIVVKMPEDFQPRENMTEEEKAAYNEELRREAEERAAAFARYEEEQREAEEARKAYEAKRQKDRETIANNMTVEDLNKEQQIYITDLVGGFGKECNLEELEETITENERPREEAVITRKVIFSTREAFETFGHYLLDDFDFLAGMGGTASEDIRLDISGFDYFKLNQEQRESVKTYCCNCVGVYVGDELQLVCDPQGYNYSRYTYKPTAESKIITATEETERQRTESESKTPFYFPAPITEQVERLEIGQQITVYQCDGWILNNIYGGAGIIEAIEPGTYAQYTGVYITLSAGKKARRVFLRDDHSALVYDGILPLLPESVTRRQIAANMYELLNYNELFPAVLDYYAKQGKKPIIDTIQR